MFYLSFCVFTLQISHVQPWHHLLRIKAPWDWGANGEDSRNYSMYRMNSPIGESSWQRSEESHSEGTSLMLFSLMLQIDRLSSHRCSSIHDTLHELVQRFRLYSTAMFHFHSASNVTILTRFQFPTLSLKRPREMKLCSPFQRIVKHLNIGQFSANLHYRHILRNKK